jgi:hypothetical protein
MLNWLPLEIERFVDVINAFARPPEISFMWLGNKEIYCILRQIV